MGSERFERACALFEEAHREDPRPAAGAIPYSVHYHRRMAFWVDRFAPDASEELLLAARAQHLRRWKIPRESYEEGRSGYKRWRSELARFHAAEAGAILKSVGYEDGAIARVGSILMKQRLASDPEVQAIEDAACLVFIENELAEFSTKHDEAKLVDIVQKTWSKMSEAGHRAAQEILTELPPAVRALLEKALSGS